MAKLMIYYISALLFRQVYQGSKNCVKWGRVEAKEVNIERKSE
jgi:hypothetical protein